MPLLSSTDWPIGHDDPWVNSRPGGVAPLRHDLALAAYLQRQQAWRASAVPRLDLRIIAKHLNALVARAVGTGRFPPAVPSPRHDH